MSQISCFGANRLSLIRSFRKKYVRILIDSATIQKIKDAADIVEVISDFVQLKKAGQNYKGLSPFTNEKTPSFFVSPNKGIYKCFSSGKGGDSISFIQEVEGLDYIETLKYLAKKYGIEVEEKELTPEEMASRTERESLFILLNFAKDYYTKTLVEHDEGKAIGGAYFKERGFHEATIEEFELGYSLEEWDAFTKEAKSKQYNPELLDKAGLTIRKEDKEYDRFRGRVIFPIHNVSGKVIAFGARILKDNKKQPKYVNSPETAVYHKSNILYGAYQAKNEVRNKDNCYLVEGYTDVISMHQAGIKNVMASSGTALTKEQIKLISRYTNNVTVLYDGDPAGIRASLRGIDLILEEGMNVRVVLLPEGEDPDSYAKSMGPSFENYLQENVKDFITFKTQLFLEESANDPVKRAEIIREIVESISKIPDSIKREVFIKQCSNLLDIAESTLVSEYNKIVLKKNKEEKNRFEREELVAMEEPPHPIDEPEIATDDSVSRSEQGTIWLLLNYAHEQLDENNSLGQYVLTESMDIEFENPVFQKIIIEFREYFNQGTVIDGTHFLEHEDELVKQEVIGLMTNRYEISQKWVSHSIYVPDDKDILGSISFKNLHRLKWIKIREMRKDYEEKLLHATDEEEIQNLIKIQMKLKQSEMQVAQVLGNVLTGY